MLLLIINVDDFNIPRSTKNNYLFCNKKLRQGKIWRDFMIYLFVSLENVGTVQKRSSKTKDGYSSFFFYKNLKR